MTRRFTREFRQQVLDDFVSRHGAYDPKLFLREVRESNGTHRAWSWFEWRDADAAEEHRLHQARLFVQGLRITFEVQTDDPRVVTLRTVTAPAYVSPVDGRSRGGGYFETDPDDPGHMAELARQGATAMETWLRRYEGIFLARGGDPGVLRNVIATLRRESEAAATGTD